MSDEHDAYLEVARRFFNEFLELKVSLDRDGAVPHKTQEKERAKYEKELRKWMEANKVLKDAAAQLMKENERLEEEFARMEVERDNLRRQVNEHLMRQSDVARKLHDYPLTEHMTDLAYKEWQDIVRLMGAPGSQKGD